MTRMKAIEALKGIRLPQRLQVGKGVVTAAGTLAIAAGIGFVMQSSESAQKRYGGSEMEVQENVKTSGAILDVEEITLTSGELENDMELPDTDTEVIKVATPPALEAPEVPGASTTGACEMVANARPVAAAMVNLTMQAPCLPNERLSIHHNGMIFTQTTDDTGSIDITVPALAENAVYILAFTNGDGAVAQTAVEELRDFDRVVLQWKGNAGFEIHAREFGAEYGAKGHVWHGAPGEVADAVTGNGGFVTRMGDTTAPEALLADIYTFPAAAADRIGNVTLSVEAEVTDANCGLEVEAQTLEIRDDGDMKTRNLTLAVPECEATGSFLVLNNLIQDLKVATN